MNKQVLERLNRKCLCACASVCAMIHRTAINIMKAQTQRNGEEECEEANTLQFTHIMKAQVCKASNNDLI